MRLSWCWFELVLNHHHSIVYWPVYVGKTDHNHVLTKLVAFLNRCIYILCNNLLYISLLCKGQSDQTTILQYMKTTLTSVCQCFTFWHQTVTIFDLSDNARISNVEIPNTALYECIINYVWKNTFHLSSHIQTKQMYLY